MTVKHINTEELDKIIADYDDNITIMAIRLTETELQSVSKETWRFIKQEINKLDDMTYTCTKLKYIGKDVKKFIFTGSNRKQVIQAIHFIDEVVCYKNVVAISNMPDQFHTTFPGVMGGVEAACPLFK